MIDLDRARAMLLKDIADGSASSRITLKEKHGEEYVDVTAEYELDGVHFEKAESRLKIQVYVNSMLPDEVMVSHERFTEQVTLDIGRKYDFLIKGSYYITLDEDSVGIVNRQARLRNFRREMAETISEREFTPDEILPVIMDYVSEEVKHSGFGTVENLLARKPADRGERPVLDISPPGAPCPHCDCMLSGDVLREMLHRLYMRYGVRGDWRDEF